MCHKKVKEWETEIKSKSQEEREKERVKSRLKEFEHECEKCTTSSCLWSSKEGNRCIGLSYLMNLLRVILGFWDMRLRNYLVKKRYLYPTRYLKSWHKVLTLASKKKRREKRKRCLGRGRGGAWFEEKNAANYQILFLGLYLDLYIIKQVDHHFDELWVCPNYLFWFCWFPGNLTIFFSIAYLKG